MLRHPAVFALSPRLVSFSHAQLYGRHTGLFISLECQGSLMLPPDARPLLPLLPLPVIFLWLMLRLTAVVA